MKKGKRGKVLVVLLITLALLSACRGPSVANPHLETRQVTDDLGRTVTIPVKVTRVVSLAPSLTENIFAAGAGDRLVGVTTFCNYPEAANSIQKVGDTISPNIETIVALKPEIVFVSTASQIEAFMKTLESNGIAVYVSNATSLDTLYNDLGHLGIIFDTQDKAESLVTELKQRENKVRTACDTAPLEDRDERLMNRVKVFVQISKEPLFTIGQGSLLNDVIQAAGGRSVTANVVSPYPKLSKETALALNPDVIILSQSDDNREPNEVFRNSPAVKNGRVISVNADLLSRPGPRLVDALEQIAKDLHPEKFK